MYIPPHQRIAIESAREAELQKVTPEIVETRAPVEPPYRTYEEYLAYMRKQVGVSISKFLGKYNNEKSLFKPVYVEVLGDPEENSEKQILLEYQYKDNAEKRGRKLSPSWKFWDEEYEMVPFTHTVTGEYALKEVIKGAAFIDFGEFTGFSGRISGEGIEGVPGFSRTVYHTYREATNIVIASDGRTWDQARVSEFEGEQYATVLESRTADFWNMCLTPYPKMREGIRDLAGRPSIRKF